MNRVIITLLLTCYALGVTAQEFTVPKGYKFEKAEDFAQYNDDIVQCFDWLMSTPAGEQSSKRQKASAFLTEWLIGSPSVSIAIDANIVNFIQPNQDLLMIFMGAWAKKALETGEKSNNVEGNLAGLESVIEYYKKNKASLQKDKNVEKYIKMQDKGKLRDFVVKNVKT